MPHIAEQITISPIQQPEVIVIRPTHGWRALALGEIWRYRELAYFLALRDVKLRYRQTALGVAWALIQPLAAMAIFSVFLGRLAQVPSDGVPYPAFAFLGLLPWTYVSNAVTTAAGSVVASANLVTKVYFPRSIIPLASVLPGLIDLLLGLGLSVVVLLVSGISPAPTVILLPLFIAFGVIVALAVGIWLSALNVQYRDVRYAIPFLVQVWLFATPVVYPASLLPLSVRPFFGLNPMAGVVEGFRWAILGRGEPPGPLLAVSAGATIAILLTGVLYFRRMERRFADVI